jgi:hypothetical protein
MKSPAFESTGHVVNNQLQTRGAEPPASAILSFAGSQEREFGELWRAGNGIAPFSQSGGAIRSAK